MFRTVYYGIYLPTVGNARRYRRLSSSRDIRESTGWGGQSEDSYQPGHLPGLIGVLAVGIVIFSCCGSLGQLNNNTQQTSVTKSIARLHSHS